MAEEQTPDESDDRFPSGAWEGHFLQRSLGVTKGRMELELRFRDGRVAGGGRDGVGPFTVAGRYETVGGKTWWTKRYASHTVFYQGYAEAKGIWGTWEIAEFDRDGFHIWPKGQGAEGESARREESPPVSFESEERTVEPSVLTAG